jgi:hypothetical protein
MKSLALNARKIEFLVYGLLWLFAFSIPYFNERTFAQINWGKLTSDWAHLLFYLLIFLVNTLLLVPHFLFEKKYTYYFVLSASVLVFFILADVVIEPAFHPDRLPELFVPPEGLQYEFPPMGKKPLVSVLIDNFVVALLIIGAGTGGKLFTKWLAEEKLRKDIEKEQLKTNLALLRHQVSPHFLMNTLNNIHALIDLNPEGAKDVVMRLSTLMRYLLYDAAQGKVMLKKEIEFINSFVALMQIRFSEKVAVTISIPEVLPEIEIPPMLFISFLENAFKHGVTCPLKLYQ